MGNRVSEYLIALILGLVEGLTEFVPVSSTGHLILVGHLLGFSGDRAETFEVFIQLGAILAVVVLYWERYLSLLDFRRGEGFTGWRGILLLGIGILPAGLLGYVTRDLIKEYLFTPLTVAVGLALGGAAILLVEWKLPAVKTERIDELSWREALVVGLTQCLSLWPGISRAASTMLGGMISGVKREVAAEYSFLLAAPLIAAASLYELYKSLPTLSAADIPVFGLGLVVSFGAAWLAVKFFLQLLQHNTLRPFGWYRLTLALVVFLVLM